MTMDTKKKSRVRAAGFDWATHIKIYRKQRGWSQDGFAKQLGIVQVTVSKWENGVMPAAISRRRLLEIEELRIPYSMFLLSRDIS